MKTDKRRRRTIKNRVRRRRSVKIDNSPVVDEFTKEFVKLLSVNNANISFDSDWTGHAWDNEDKTASESLYNVIKNLYIEYYGESNMVKWEANKDVTFELAD